MQLVLDGWLMRRLGSTIHHPLFHDYYDFVLISLDVVPRGGKECRLNDQPRLQLLSHRWMHQKIIFALSYRRKKTHHVLGVHLLTASTVWRSWDSTQRIARLPIAWEGAPLAVAYRDVATPWSKRSELTYFWICWMNTRPPLLTSTWRLPGIRIHLNRNTTILNTTYYDGHQAA